MAPEGPAITTKFPSPTSKSWCWISVHCIGANSPSLSWKHRHLANPWMPSSCLCCCFSYDPKLGFCKTRSKGVFVCALEVFLMIQPEMASMRVRSSPSYYILSHKVWVFSSFLSLPVALDVIQFTISLLGALDAIHHSHSPAIWENISYCSFSFWIFFCICIDWARANGYVFPSLPASWLTDVSLVTGQLVEFSPQSCRSVFQWPKWIYSIKVVTSGLLQGYVHVQEAATSTVYVGVSLPWPSCTRVN